MAQKSNPIILRLLKTNRFFDSCWFNRSNYVYLLMRDFKIRNYINGILKTMNASSARFLIQNLHNKQKINVFFCNLEKTKNRINRTLKQGSVSTPIKTRKLNVHRNLLYKNDKALSSTCSRVPLQLHLNNQNAHTFFTHDKIFSFLNKHLTTISHEKNVYTACNSVLNNRIKESMTIEKLQLTSLRYFIIKYYILNSNGFINSKFACNFNSEDNSKHLEYGVHKLRKKLYIKYFLKTRLNFIFSKMHEIFPISKHFILQKHKKKIVLSFLKHQKQYYTKKKMFYAANSRKLQSKSTVDYVNSDVSLKKNIPENDILYNNNKYIEKQVLDYNLAERNFTETPFFSVFRTIYFIDDNKNTNKQSKFFTFAKSLKFLYTPYTYLSFSSKTVFSAEKIFSNTYNLKNTNLKAKNQFCNKLILNSVLVKKKENGNVLSIKTKSPFLFSTSLFTKIPYTGTGISIPKFSVACTAKNLDLQLIKNTKRNFINTCHTDIHISSYVICSCINKTHLYTTYNNYCNIGVVHSIENGKSAMLKTLGTVTSKQPKFKYPQVSSVFKTDPERIFDACTHKTKSYAHTGGKYLGWKIPKAGKPKMISENSQSYKNTTKMAKLYIANTAYKRHIECVIQKNVLCKNPAYIPNVNLHFFMSTNIFQNATYLMDIFVYYLEKKMPFFKLKNMVLKQLTELKPLIVKGVLVQCSGRVAMKSKKAQKAKIQTFKYGETGLHVFNSKLDFKSSSAFTSFGTIGIKIWICYF